MSGIFYRNPSRPEREVKNKQAAESYTPEYMKMGIEPTEDLAMVARNPIFRTDLKQEKIEDELPSVNKKQFRYQDVPNPPPNIFKSGTGRPLEETVTNHFHNTSWREDAPPLQYVEEEVVISGSQKRQDSSNKIKVPTIIDVPAGHYVLLVKGAPIFSSHDSNEVIGQMEHLIFEEEVRATDCQIFKNIKLHFGVSIEG